MGNRPYIGEPVHYVSYGTPGGEYQSKCRAAFVTETAEDLYPLFPGVKDDSASLCVLNPTGTFYNRNVPYDQMRDGGTWHAMEDCPDV